MSLYTLTNAGEGWIDIWDQVTEGYRRIELESEVIKTNYPWLTEKALLTVVFNLENNKEVYVLDTEEQKNVYEQNTPEVSQLKGSLGEDAILRSQSDKFDRVQKFELAIKQIFRSMYKNGT